MSDFQPDPSWWRADDGRWYAPELHPDYVAPAPPPPVETPAPKTAKVRGTPGSGPEEIVARSAQGAAAERRTADELARLPETYRVFHGLKVGRTRSDIDHLVIGPSGVWVIDSKCWNSPVQIDQGRLRTGRYDKQDVLDAVEWQAAYASAVLGVPSNPALCFVDTSIPRPVQAVGRVRVITLEALCDYVVDAPAVLSSSGVASADLIAIEWMRRPPNTPVPPKKSAVAPVASIARPTKRSTTRRPKATRRTAASGAARPATKRFSGKKMVGLLLVVAFAYSVYKGSPKAATSLSNELTGRTPSSATTTVAPPDGAAPPTIPELFRIQIDCPESGKGYNVFGRTTGPPGTRVRVTLLSGFAPEYLGEFSQFDYTRSATRFGPNAEVVFEIQPVDPLGQGGVSYRQSVVTPAAAC